MNTPAILVEDVSTPLDLLEEWAKSVHAPTARHGDTLVVGFSAPGGTEYSVHFKMFDEGPSLRCVCPYTFTFGKNKKNKILDLVNKINLSVFNVVFAVTSDDAQKTFSVVCAFSAPYDDDDNLQYSRLNLFIGETLECCENYYQAFDDVLKDRHPPGTAFRFALYLFDTQGNA